MSEIVTNLNCLSELKRYFSIIVEPTVSDFLSSYESKKDLRKAALSAIVLTHFADQYAFFEEGIKSWQRQKWEQYKNKIDVDCSAIAPLRECSNFIKHRFLSSQLESLTQTTHPGIFNAPFGQGYFEEASHVYYKDNNMFFLVKEVFEYWKLKLQEF